MKTDRFTLDTNILVYAAVVASDPRHRISQMVIEQAVRARCILTLQAVEEFYAVVTRKNLLTRAAAANSASDWLSLFPCVAGSASATRASLTLAAAGTASLWDALLITAAAEHGCTSILTEDLHDGGQLAGVRIVNPFGTGSLSPEAAQLLAPA